MLIGGTRGGSPAADVQWLSRGRCHLKHPPFGEVTSPSRARSSFVVDAADAAGVGVGAGAALVVRSRPFGSGTALTRNVSAGATTPGTNVVVDEGDGTAPSVPPTASSEYE